MQTPNTKAGAITEEIMAKIGSLVDKAADLKPNPNNRACTCGGANHGIAA